MSNSTFFSSSCSCLGYIRRLLLCGPLHVPCFYLFAPQSFPLSRCLERFLTLIFLWRWMLLLPFPGSPLINNVYGCPFWFPIPLLWTWSFSRGQFPPLQEPLLSLFGIAFHHPWSYLLFLFQKLPPFPAHSWQSFLFFSTPMKFFFFDLFCHFSSS